MNPNELLNGFISARINQAITNQQNITNPLPPDQQEAETNLLNAIHDISENMAKIRPEYQERVLDAMILKATSEFGWFNGGMR